VLTTNAQPGYEDETKYAMTNVGLVVKVKD